MMCEYEQYVGTDHRRSFGQFFTPPAVSKFMARWVLDSGNRSLFDPAFGLGAFREAIPENAGVEFSACEVDPKIIEFWQRKTGKNAEFVAAEDYLRSWGRTHSNIVCNPPYMRFQKFLNRSRVFQEFQRRLGIRLSGYTNTASAFLLKSISELGPSGRLAYIMPLEFLNTGYGSLVKQRLVESAHLFAILRFDCEKDIFPDAITSVGIILYDNATDYNSVKFYSMGAIAELDFFDKIEPIVDIPIEALDPRSKWLPLFEKTTFGVDPDRMTTLRFFGTFSRGIATGANEFFVLRPSTAEAKGIHGKGECVPCITKSSQIDKPIFDDADYDQLYDSNKPVLLFSVNGEHSEEAEEYIKSGQTAGFDKRFLTKNRNPWYKTEQRQPCPLLLGVFSRGGYKIVLNKSRTLHLTCFHGFQPNLLGYQYVEHLFLYLSSKVGREIAGLSMRKYGDSLDKFEPNDLNDALVPSLDFLASMPTRKVSEAVKTINDGGRLPQWAENFFAPLKVEAGIGYPTPYRRAWTEKTKQIGGRNRQGVAHETSQSS